MMVEMLLLLLLLVLDVLLVTSDSLCVDVGIVLHIALCTLFVFVAVEAVAVDIPDRGGGSSPFSSASRIMNRAARSLPVPPGFILSILTYMCFPFPSKRLSFLR